MSMSDFRIGGSGDRPGGLEVFDFLFFAISRDVAV